MFKFLVVFTPLYITMFWSIVFLTNAFRFNKPRFWLGVFMLLVTVLYGCHAIFFLGYKDLYLKIDSVYMLVGLSVYPMYYLYIRLLTCDLYPSYRYALHFLPAFILAFIFMFLSVIAERDHREWYYQTTLLTNKWPGEGAHALTKVMSFVFFASRIVFGLQVLFYLGKGYYLIRRYEKNIANFYSNLEGKELVWVKLLTISFFLTSLISTGANLLGRGQFMGNLSLLMIPSVLFSVLFFVVGLQGNKQDQSVLVNVEEELELPEEECCLADAGVNGLKQRLLQLLEEEQLYLNPDIRVTELCQRLTTNRTYLSKLINEEFNSNFNDFINRYRVVYACHLLKEDRNGQLPIVQIAEQSGFGSLSSLNRSFKKEFGQTPGEYRRSLNL